VTLQRPSGWPPGLARELFLPSMGRVGCRENRRRRGGPVNESLGISATAQSGFPQDRADSMTDTDILSRDIHALKELQRVAWAQLASPSLTNFDRREIRNRIRQSEVDLRNYLTMRSERTGLPMRPVPEASYRARPDFRLIAAD